MCFDLLLRPKLSFLSKKKKMFSVDIYRPPYRTHERPLVVSFVCYYYRCLCFQLITSRNKDCCNSLGQLDVHPQSHSFTYNKSVFESFLTSNSTAQAYMPRQRWRMIEHFGGGHRLSVPRFLQLICEQCKLFRYGEELRWSECRGTARWRFWALHIDRGPWHISPKFA